jgi:hypothetical protein
MGRTATLSAGLVRKGEARPVVVTAEAVDTVPVVQAEPATAATDGSGANYYKSLTVKLDRSRYEALKQAGMRADKKSQAIFTEALDLWLKTHGAGSPA